MQCCFETTVDLASQDAMLVNMHGLKYLPVYLLASATNHLLELFTDVQFSFDMLPAEVAF